MKTTQIVAEATEPVITTEPTEVEVTPEYSGIETWIETNVVGQPTTFTRKINMSDTEVTKFLGGNDSKIYFKNGKIPISYKSMGNILNDEDEEITALKEVMPNMKQILLFKHRHQPLYTLLVPKMFSEFELDGENEIMSDFIVADTRSIVFGASNSPRSYDKTYFKNNLRRIYEKLKSSAERVTDFVARG